MDDGFNIGLCGSDSLSSALARSLAAHEIPVAISAEPGATFSSMDDPTEWGVTAAEGIEPLAEALKRPRTMLLRMAAGSAFETALGCLEPDDLIIDASDCWFRDTSLRAQAAAARGVHFLALGLAPNENSTIPLLMAGGRPDLYSRVSPWLEAAASHAEGQRGAGYLGSGPAGHFVRMTHGAVENAVREIVREARALLVRGLGAEAGDLLQARRDDPLFDYLRVPMTGRRSPADRDLARWAVRAGHELEIPMLTLEAASGARSWANREALAEPFCQPHGPLRHDAASLVAEADGAISVAMVIAYTEGLALLATASDRLGFHIDIPESARVWRAGASWRARLLADIQNAFQVTPGLPNLLFDEDFSERVMDFQELLRHAVWQGDEWNLPTPALAAALHYIDTFRDAWLPINLVQPDDFHFTPRPSPAYAAAPVMEWEDDGFSATDPPFA